MRKIMLLSLVLIFAVGIAMAQEDESKKIDYSNPKEVNNLPPQDIANGIEQGKIDPKIVDDKKLASALKEKNEIAPKLNDDDLARALRQDKSLIDKANNPQIFTEITARGPEFLNTNPDIKAAWFENYKVKIAPGAKVTSIEGYYEGIFVSLESGTSFNLEDYPGAVIDDDAKVSITGNELIDGHIYKDGSGNTILAGGQLEIGKTSFFPLNSLSYDPISGTVSGQQIFVFYEEDIMQFSGYLKSTDNGYELGEYSRVRLYAKESDDKIKAYDIQTAQRKLDLSRQLEFCKSGLNCVEVKPETSRVKASRAGYTTVSLIQSQDISEMEFLIRMPQSSSLEITNPNGRTTIHDANGIVKHGISQQGLLLELREVGSGWQKVSEETLIKDLQSFPNVKPRPEQPVVMEALDTISNAKKLLTNPKIQAGSSEFEAKIGKNPLARFKIPLLGGTLTGSVQVNNILRGFRDHQVWVNWKKETDPK